MRAEPASAIQSRPLKTCPETLAFAGGPAGVSNTLTKLVLAFHYALLHGMQLVVSPDWIWTKRLVLDGGNASFADVYWPSGCDAHAHRAESRGGGDGLDAARLYMGQQATSGTLGCANFACSWANEVPPPFSGMCVSWCAAPAFTRAHGWREIARLSVCLRQVAQPNGPISGAAFGSAAAVGASACSSRWGLPLVYLVWCAVD